MTPAERDVFKKKLDRKFNPFRAIAVKAARASSKIKTAADERPPHSEFRFGNDSFPVFSLGWTNGANGV